MSNEDSGCGCVGTLIGLIIVWAFCFGVTVNGHHYGFDLSCGKGVEVKK